MTDKWLVTAEGYYEAGGSVQHAFWGEFQNSFLFGFVRKAKKNQNKNKNVWSLPSLRSPRLFENMWQNNVKVVMKLCSGW